MTREEIAGRLATLGHASVIDTGEVQRIADAVRALPVLTTCGECGWIYGSLYRHRRVWWCSRDRQRRDVNPEEAPPTWCRLRGRR